MTSSELARKSFESFNGITNDAGKEDLIFKYDASQQQEILKAKPWSSNPNYFRKVHISAVALLKMTIHAKSGGDIEVMGLMLGKIVGETMVVMDAFRLPVEGTETRVNAQADGYEYMVEFMKLAKESGRMENAIGWYHSHPGYGCWLSGIDVATQMLHQKYQEPFLAVVIDPKRTISAGKVEIGAFRTYPEGWKDTNINSSTSSFQSVPMEKIEDFGVHCNQYYSLEISYFKSSSDAQILQMLWNKYWINSLASSPFISNRDFMNKKISDLCHKLESCRSDGQGRLNAAIANDLKSAGNDKKKQQGSLITSGLEKVREGQMHPSSKPGFGCLYRESERKHKLAKSGGIHRCARDSANLSIETIYNTLQHLALLSSMLNDISEEKRVQVKGLKVRLATVDDIPELVKLINLAYKDAHWFKQPCFYDRVSSESLKQYMNQTTIPAPTTTTTTSIDGGVSASAGTIGNHFFVLEIGNSLIACTYLRAPAIHSQILVSSLSLLSIHPEFQRKGLAKLLFDICCKTVAALFQGNSNLLMQVEVVSLQTHLLDIYGKWGFKQVSTITWKDLGIDEKVNIKIPCHLVVMQMPIS